MIKALPFAIMALMFASACKKTETQIEAEQQELITPLPTTSTTSGSLSGSVSPAESISRIVATAAKDNKKYIAQLFADGTFSATGLPEDSYSLEFTPSDFFEKPANTNIEVKAGKNTTASAITAIEKSGALSCYVNGQYQSWYRKGYHSGTMLQLVKLTTGTGIPEFDIKAEPAYDLGISLRPFNGPGTYICDPSTSSKLSYKLIKGGLATSIQDTGMQGSSATVIITSIDPVAKKIKGTSPYSSRSQCLSRITTASQTKDLLPLKLKNKAAKGSALYRT